MNKIPLTNYYRKWTRMPWWSRLYHLKERNQLPPESELWNDLQRFLHPMDKYWKYLNLNMEKDAKIKTFGELNYRTRKQENTK